VEARQASRAITRAGDMCEQDNPGSTLRSRRARGAARRPAGRWSMMAAMSSAAATQRPTVDSFLEWERQQDERYELLDGLTCAMTGGTLDHNTIVGNLRHSLRIALPAGCRAFSENVKVIVDESVTYPDVLVTCAPVDLKSDHIDQPTLIVEVLSRSTHEIDRGRKWLAYQRIPSLQQYVLVSQDEARIESYRRAETGWAYTIVTGLDASVRLEPLTSATPLADIYADTSVAALEPSIKP